MRYRIASLVFLLAAGVPLPAAHEPGAPATGRNSSDPGAIEFFEKRGRPVLVRHCYACHSTEAQKKRKLRGGLRLDSQDGVRKGGDSGPAVVPGKADDSLLIRSVRYDGDPKMPPAGKLPDAVIADLERWVRMGAPDPRSGPAGAGGPRLGTSIEEGRNFWAYRPPHRPAVPAVEDSAWPANDIDRFILARLEREGLRPAGEADRAVLARRLYFDLLGLPPTPEEVDAFAADPDPAACAKLVDRLLASPHFGERWGRHWLDLARYGESLTLRGFVLKEAWRYRDYVIDAFNEDVPFDRFVREQIAGDLLPAETAADRRRQLVATTFLTLGNTNLEQQDKKQLRMDVVDEQLDVIGKAILAQTIACARCHDHKFDPIPTADYYALAGILRNTRTLEHANVSHWLEVPLPADPPEEAVLQKHEAAIAALQTRIRAETSRAGAAGTAAGSAGPPSKAASDNLRKLQEELKRLQDAGPKRALAMSVVEEKQIEDARIHVRGSVHNLGESVPRGFLRVATLGPAPSLPANQSGRRELAEWLTSPDNPLTARAIVNRAWHWLFGSGIVRTTDNFGTTGETPSHPELLDHLAVRFVEDGWSIRKLVRAIVLSRTYRQSSAASARAVAADPENRWFGRSNRRRLDAEVVRDTLLSVGGRLRLDRGGPTFPANLAADYGYRHTDARRSVYAPVFRNALPELFEVFDFADPSMVVGRRNASTVAPQALFLLNHPFAVEQSRHAAARLLAEVDDDERRIERLYRLALGRLPDDGERRVARFFLRGRADDAGAAWSILFQAVFASADFRYVN
jgi:hypothetical protein